MVITDSLAEVGFTSPRMPDFGPPPDGDQVILTSRNSQTGALTEEAPQFPPEQQNRIETSFLNPNGKYAYVIADGPEIQNSEDENYQIFFAVYQRQTSGAFTLLTQTAIDGGSQFMCPHYTLSGIMHADSDYLVVNSSVGCHPDGGSKLQLFQLSSAGDSVLQTTNVSSSIYEDMTVGWKQNLIFANGEINEFGSTFSFSQFVYRVSNGQTQEVARCDANVRGDCLNFTSVVLGSTAKYAFGLSETIRLIAWDEATHNMSFVDTGIAGTNGDNLYIDPSGQYLLVTGSASKQIRVYRIDGSTHALTGVPGSPFTGPGTILNLAFEPAP